MHLPVGAACAVVAVAAVALSLGAPEPAWQRAVISALTSTMLAGAVVLVRDSRRGRVRVLGGELIVDAAFADIVVVLASRPAGAPLRAAEFVVALAGLAAGTAALALAPLARGGVAAAVRAAVTVVTGAVLAAVAAGQLERPGFAVSWSWTPFLAFAVPGMLAVLGAEVAGRSRTSRRLTILSGAARVAGVALLLYGSVNNLGLGAGGWGAGVAPGAWTAAGWVAAAAALAVGSSTRTPGSPPAAVLAAAGVAAMAVCERAAILRMDPALGPAGAAASHGAPIAAAALAVLAGLPVLARHHGAPAPAGRRLREKGQVARAELQGRRRDVVLEV